MKVIPLSAQAGITGFESPAAEYSQVKLTLDELLVEHPSATFIGLATGDSMQDIGIFDNDLLIVDRHVKKREIEVIVANLNGEFVCKILNSKERTLYSANGDHSPVPISEYDEFTVEGVVTRSIRCHRELKVACLH